MRKLICLLMALLVFVGVIFLPSCKKENENDDTVSTQDSEDTLSTDMVDKTAQYLEKFDGVDMSGKEIWVYDLNVNPDIHVNYYDELQGDPMNVKLYERDLYFKDKYGVTVEYFVNTGGSKMISNAVLSGAFIADIVYGRASGDRLMTLALNGCLDDMKSYDQLDFSQPWWGNFMAEQLTVNNKLFFTSGDVLPTFYQSIGCFFYNIDVGTDYGISKDQLCKTVLDGNFTWEYMMNLIKNADEDLTGDGIVSADNDFFGLCTYNATNHTNMWTIGAGIDLVQKTETGEYVVDFKNPSTEKVLSELKKYITFTEMGSNTMDSITQTTFKSGRAIFAEHFTESAFHQLRDMEDDYLMLPVPKLYEDQKDYRCMVNSYVNCFVGIVSNCAERDVTGTFLESLACFGYNEIRPVAYEEFLKLTLARDAAATELVDLIFDTAYIDYGVVERLGENKELPNGIADILYNYLKLDAPLASTFTANESAINQDLKDTLAPFFK